MRTEYTKPLIRITQIGPLRSDYAPKKGALTAVQPS